MKNTEKVLYYCERKWQTREAYELGRKILGEVKPEEDEKTVTSLNDLVARLANFSQFAEEALKETEEKDVFLDSADFLE